MYFYVNEKLLRDQITYLQDELRQVREWKEEMKQKRDQISLENQKYYFRMIQRLDGVECSFAETVKVLEDFNENYQKFLVQTSTRLEEMIEQTKRLF